MRKPLTDTLRVAWICEGGGRLGWGHVGRGRAVLERAAPGSALVVGRGWREVERWASESGCPWEIRPWSGRYLPFRSMRLPFDAIVIDSYALSNDWVTGAALRVPMALVDDWTRQRFDVPILVNANIGARATDYPLGRARRWLTGARAALLRREVVEARRRRPPGGPVDEVLVTLGGSDPHGVSAVIVADIRRTPWFREGGRLTVVLGASYRGPSLRSGPRLEVVRSPRDFMARCVAADLAVCGAATTTYELAFLGTPFVPVATVDNQERIATAWARQGVGFAISTASRRWRAVLRDAVTDATSRPETCQHTAARVQRLVDGRGAARLLSALRELLACSRGPSVQRGLVGH